MVPDTGVDALVMMVIPPPLLDIAGLLKIKRRQSSSDQDMIPHVARVPILTLIGLSDDSGPIQVGANTSINIPLGGDAKFVEHSEHGGGDG